MPDKTEVLYVRCTPQFKREIKHLMIDLGKRSLEETLEFLVEEYKRLKEIEKRAPEVKMV